MWNPHRVWYVWSWSYKFILSLPPQSCNGSFSSKLPTYIPWVFTYCRRTKHPKFCLVINVPNFSNLTKVGSLWPFRPLDSSACQARVFGQNTHCFPFTVKKGCDRHTREQTRSLKRPFRCLDYLLNSCVYTSNHGFPGWQFVKPGTHDFPVFYQPVQKGF